jgi:hypothetical protein
MMGADTGDHHDPGLAETATSCSAKARSNAAPKLRWHNNS